MIDAMNAHAPAAPGLSYERFLSVRRRATVVDVLPGVSFEDGHIPGSVSLPLSEIPVRASEVLPEKHARIVVYCGGPT